MQFLDLGGHSSLGDDGLRALVPALSAGLIRLTINDCSIGDAGMIALAAVLPSKNNLRTLDVGYSPGVTPKGWTALGDAVGRMPHLEELYRLRLTIHFLRTFIIFCMQTVEILRIGLTGILTDSGAFYMLMLNSS